MPDEKKAPSRVYNIQMTKEELDLASRHLWNGIYREVYFLLTSWQNQMNKQDFDAQQAELQEQVTKEAAKLRVVPNAA